MKKLLVACEFSGTVREAFAKKGWDAWSCDLLQLINQVISIFKEIVLKLLVVKNGT